jgi:broad specificity polyphosphatase/5'/3'-nucleotidase SurE
VRRDSPDLTSAARSEYSAAKGQFTQPGTDAYAMAQGYVSITPLSLDHTSRITMDEVQALIEREA